MFERFFYMKGLSRSEVRVANLVCYGMTSRDIGKELFITEKGVKWHLGSIFKKLGVKQRAQVIVMTWANHAGVHLPKKYFDIKSVPETDRLPIGGL